MLPTADKIMLPNLKELNQGVDVLAAPLHRFGFEDALISGYRYPNNGARASPCDQSLRIIHLSEPYLRIFGNHWSAPKQVLNCPYD